MVVFQQASLQSNRPLLGTIDFISSFARDHMFPIAAAGGSDEDLNYKNAAAQY